jgi:hypothetical protein
MLYIVNSQRIRLCFGDAHCEKVAKKYRSVVGASPTARSSPASALGPNCGALASDESISRPIRTEARKFEALFVSIWSNAAVTNIMLAAAWAAAHVACAPLTALVGGDALLHQK